jgi:hypothetical protein
VATNRISTVLRRSSLDRIQITFATNALPLDHDVE